MRWEWGQKVQVDIRDLPFFRLQRRTHIRHVVRKIEVASTMATMAGDVPQNHCSSWEGRGISERGIEMKESTTFDRRQFVQGAAIAGTGAALAGFADRHVFANAEEGAGLPAETQAEYRIEMASINPQDYDYMQNTTNFETLFSPIKIGPLELGNRIVKSAAGSATYLAGLTDELFQYYVNFAKGGVELIWFENVAALQPPFEDEAAEQEAKDFAARLVSECAKYNSHLGVQCAFSSSIPLAEMTIEDIHAVEENAAATAQWFQSIGFEAIEVHAAGGILASQMLRRATNTRTDEYGPDSFENRTRFVCECIQKIKEACGQDFVVQVLMHCIEENDNITNNATMMTLDKDVTVPHNLSTTVEEGVEFAKCFEAAGADSLHLRLGPIDSHPAQVGSDLYFLLYGLEGATGYGAQWNFKRHWQGQLIANHSGAGLTLDVVKRYKEAVNIPCGAVTYMDPAHAPDYFESALADGKADFFLMTRPLTVDTEYVNKLREGRIDEIAPCTRCLHCHISGNQANRDMGYCRVNALTQRVMTENGPATYELQPADTPKRVMIAGGGPAGMEAARIAAARGHEVTLFEKSGMLGGMLPFASTIKGPHENLDQLRTYLERQLEINGVNVQLETEVTPDLVSSEAPDVLVVATGGKRRAFEGENDGTVPIIDYDSFWTSDIPGENIVIVGGNAQAWDCALWFTVRGKFVQLVADCANADLDMQQSQHAQRWMTTALYSLGVKAWPSSNVIAIRDGQVIVDTGEGIERAFPCDALIVGAEMDPDTSLLDGSSVAEAYAIGDCNNPFNIALAIRGGNDVGRAI